MNILWQNCDNGKTRYHTILFSDRPVSKGNDPARDGVLKEAPSNYFVKRSQTQAEQRTKRQQNFHGVSKSRENNEAIVWTESQGSFGEFAKWSAVSREVVWWPFKMVRGATKDSIPGRLFFSWTIAEL